VDDEILEMDSQRSEVPRNQYAASIGATCRTIGSEVQSGITPAAT
jgi:hypothetical protein